jgi:prophage DNA circulation protein
MKTILIAMLFIARHGWRCFTAKAVGFSLLTAGTLLVSIALFTTCDNNNNKTDPQCECAVKVQPFGTPCACPVAGTSACDCSEEIQREFNDLTFLGKTITLIDRTNGATDLKVRGIWQKIQGALNTQANLSAIENKFFAIHGTGKFALVVESGANYTYGYVANGYEVRYRENQLLNDLSSDDIVECIATAIEYDMIAP